MTDRGRLDYTLATKDEFSADLSRLKRELSENRTEFKRFKKDVAALTSTNRSFTTGLAKLRRESRALTTANTNRARSITRLGTAQAQAVAREREVARARIQGISANANLARHEAQRVRTVRNLNRQLRQSGTAQRKAASGAKQLTAATNTASRGAKKLKNEAKGLTRVLQNVFFTFRRLVGVLALFTIAREVAAGFQAMISESVRFNAVLEQNELGIASLLASVADVRNEFGQTVDVQEKLNLAQEESRRQLRLLQAEAQNTAASYEDLVSAFQVALGPGLDAGLQVDQVRKLTVQISQAASALAVPQNQLAEEIRSLLSGTITAKNTRIATVLNITNADIKRVREAGTLAQFLEKRFEAFSAAGAKATKTFAGLSTNTLDAFRRLLAEANFDLFEEFKGILGDVLSAVQRVNDEGFLEIRPEVLAAVKALGDGLGQVAREAREAGKQLSLEDLRPSVEALGAVLAGAGETVVGIVQGIFQAVGLLQAIGRLFLAFGQFLKPVIDFFTGGGLTKSLRESVAEGTTLLTLFAAIEVVVLAGTAALARWPVILAAVAAAGLIKAMEKILNAVTGVNTQFSSVTVLTAALVAGLLIAIAAVSELGNGFKGLSIFAQATGKTLEKEFLVPLRQAVALLKIVRGDRAEGLADFAEATTDIGRLKGEIADLNEQSKDLDVPFENRIAEINRKLSAALDSGKGLAGVLGAARDLIGAGASQAEKLTKETDKTGGFLTRNVKRLSEQQKVIEALAGGLKKANQALEAARFTTGLGVAASTAKSLTVELAAQRQQLALTQPFLQERARILGEIEGAETRLALAIAQNLQNEAAGLPGRIELQRIAAEIVASREKLVGVEQDILTITQQIAQARDTTLVALVVQETAALREKNFVSVEALRLELAAGRARREGNDVRADQLVKDAGILRLERERELALERSASKIRTLLELLARLQAARAAAAAGTAPPGTDPVLLAQQEAEAQAGLNALALEREGIVLRTNDLLEKQKDIKVGDAKTTEDFITGLKESTDAYKASLNILQSAVASFSAEASAAIVDSLDPTKDVDLLQRFADFLSQIAKMIIQTFIQIAIQKAILGLASAAAGGGGVSGVLDGALGRAQGGSVPSGNFLLSPAHLAPNVQSFNRGGAPASVADSDIVPAWLTPGEWVMRAAAVGKYGSRIMDAINRGLINPAALQGLLHGIAPTMVKAPKPSKGPGFASGGEVPGGSPQESGPAFTPAVVVADEQTFSRLLAQGQGPMLDFLRDNVPNIMAESRSSGLS